MGALEEINYNLIKLVMNKDFEEETILEKIAELEKRFSDSKYNLSVALLKSQNPRPISPPPK